MDKKDPASSGVGDTTDQFNDSDDQSGDVGTGSVSGSGSGGKGSGDDVGGDTCTGSGSSSMEKKDRVAIDDELVDLHNAMKAMISSMHAAGEIRNRVDEYSVKYKITEIGCSKKETDDELDSRLDNLKSEHYRTEDCINSTLEMNAAADDDQSGESSRSDVAITGSGSGSGSDEGKGSDDDVRSTSTESGSSSADIDHDVSAADDAEGSMGGSDED